MKGTIMHTTEGTEYRFFHNGDYSGDVIARNKKTGDETTIPFEDMKRLVASWVMSEKIAILEQAEDDELLGVADTTRPASADDGYTVSEDMFL